jgi:hypothetical protein
VLERWPPLRATLFELSPVPAIARERLAGNALAERIQVVDGDFLLDPIPPGHDGVIIANIAHNLSPDRNVELLRRVRDRVPDGARLLMVDFWTDASHTTLRSPRSWPASSS